MELEGIRVAVYESFSKRGHAPTHEELATLLDLSTAEVVVILRRLASGRHLVLGANDQILMAHPFSAVPLGFSVMGDRTLWWGGCAWDSFALPHLVPEQSPVLVATRCPACGRPHAWSVGTEGPPDGDQVAHFLVPAARMWDNVLRTCGNQRIFCSRDCVRDWLTSTGHEEGAVLDLPTLWRLAAHWYDGRMSRDYVRRDPTSAAEYLRIVGLSGKFWGLS
jgi:hypothetical protein